MKNYPLLTWPVYMYTVLQPGSGSLSYLNNTIPMNVIKIDGAHPGVKDSSPIKFSRLRHDEKYLSYDLRRLHSTSST